MNMMAANEEALRRKMPDFLHALSHADCGADDDITIMPSEAKDGSAIDVLLCGGAQYIMQSRYRPGEEAYSFAKKYADLKPDSCILFLGFGNGYIARELTSHKEACFVFYEPSLSYFSYVLGHYDISDILLADNIHIYVKGVNDKLLSHDMYIYVHALNWPVFYLESLPKYQQIFGHEMDDLTRLYAESKSHAIQNYDVDIRFAERNLYNAIHNLEFIYTGHSICEYEQCLRPEIPVVVVAAGPSLERNVGLLKELRNHALILCVDRAAPVLAQAGIVPHAYVTADAEKETSLFAEAKSNHIPWFAYTTSNYDALSMVSGEIIFCSSFYAYAYDLFRHVGSDLYTLANGGSVATIAVSIALNMGSKTIILVGQDLALTGEKVHAGEEKTDISKEDYRTFEVPGYYGYPVVTRQDYKSYIDWYSAYCAKHDDVTFINATEGGAYISGMQHISLSEAARLYGVPEFDGDDVFSSVGTLMTPEHQALLAKDYLNLLSYFKQVKREVSPAITILERAVKALQDTGLQAKEVSQAERQMDRFQSIYNGHTGKTILDLCIAKEIREALLDVNFKEKDIRLELIRLYQKMLTFYKGVRRAVDKALPMLLEVLDVLKIR